MNGCSLLTYGLQILVWLYLSRDIGVHAIQKLAITTGDTSTSLTAILCSCGLLKPEIIYLIKYELGSNMDERRENFNFQAHHRNPQAASTSFPLSQLVASKCKDNSDTKGGKTLKKTIRSFRQVSMTVRQTLLRASATSFRKPPAFVFINTCYHEVPCY